MNRLIIIGNGFDLAHGLETSCKSFVLHYLSKVWTRLSDGSYNDRLLSIRRSTEYFRKNDLNYSSDTALSIFKKIHKTSSNGFDDAYMSIKSNFFKSIFTKILTLNWADVETEYFNELYHIIETTNRSKQNNTDRVDLESHKNHQVKRLNEDLDYLQNFLFEHLKNEETKFKKNGQSNNQYSKCFTEMIYEGEKVIVSKGYPEKTLFLNFNYTNTLSKYQNGENIIQIHGTLENNPIFGFGDDTSEKYKELEDEYNNEILKKIKSFKYLDNDKYSKLIHFINLGTFQVQVFGHSCGVSDRTLFKQIFENQYCLRIKIFYHNEKDFEEKKYEISRHFENKVEFLKKVISFDNLRKMPQAKNN